MATLTELLTLAGDATFRGKIRMAALNAGLAVMGETSSGKGLVDQKRGAFAAAVLADGCSAKLDAVAYAAAAYGTLTGSSTDGDIQFVVNSIFSDLATVNGADLL